MKNIKLLFLLLITLLNLDTLMAVTNYVDGVNGDDTDYGTNWATAWRTIGHGVSNTFAGDTLLIAQASYAEEVKFPNNGSSGNLIQIWEYTNGVVIDGSSQSNCININSKSYILLKGLSCYNANSGSGFKIINSTNIYLIDNDTFNNKQAVLLSNVRSCYMATNRFRNSTSYGIYAQYSSSNTIMSNQLYGNSGDGILLYYCRKNRFFKNRTFSNGTRGIYLMYSHNNIIMSNLSYGNSGGAGTISLYISSTNSITGNECYGNANGLIYVRGNSCNYNSIVGNVLHDSNNDGIKFQNGSFNNNSIKRNEIYNINNYYGVEFMGGGPAYYDNIIKGNRFYNCATGGIMINACEANRVQIISNQIIKCNGGIRFNCNNNNIIYNNIIMSNSSYGIELGNPFASDDNIIAWNQINNNNQGLRIYNSDRGVISRNCYYNNSYGIYAITGTDNQIDNETYYNNTSYGIYFNGNNGWISDIITYQNGTGLYLPNTVSISNSCINDGFAGTLLSLGSGCITNSPQFKNPNDTDFFLLWSSPCIQPEHINQVQSCMGYYPISVYTINDVTNQNSAHCFTFKTPVMSTGIPNNAIIEIKYTNENFSSTFDLDNITKITSTSYWGGSSPSFSFSSSTAFQNITIQRTGGVTSLKGHTENIIVYGITNTETIGTNYQVLVSIKSNNGALILRELSNYFRIWHPPLVYVNKTVVSNTLSGSPNVLIPGSTLRYNISFDNDGDNSARWVEFIDNIPASATFVSNSVVIEVVPDISVDVEYYAGGSWYTNDQGQLTEKIKWKFYSKIRPHNGEASDTIGICDGDFPDEDSGIFSFKVIVQ